MIQSSERRGHNSRAARNNGWPLCMPWSDWYDNIDIAGIWYRRRREGDTTLGRPETKSGHRSCLDQKSQSSIVRRGYVSFRLRVRKGMRNTSNIWYFYAPGLKGPQGHLSYVPVDFLRPKFRVPHTKHDVISILMKEYTYINMYNIKKIISCIFILCWDITALLKLKWKFAGYV